jgi:hypothetical protein
MCGLCPMVIIARENSNFTEVVYNNTEYSGYLCPRLFRHLQVLISVKAFGKALNLLKKNKFVSYKKEYAKSLLSH